MGNITIQGDYTGSGGGGGGTGGISVNYTLIAGANTVTPDSANGYSEITLDRAMTTIAAPTYQGSGTLQAGQIFSLKLKHTLDGSDVTWNAAYTGASSFPPSGVNGQYNVYTFICRSSSVVELMAVPLIGVTN